MVDFNRNALDGRLLIQTVTSLGSKISYQYKESIQHVVGLDNDYPLAGGYPVVTQKKIDEIFSQKLQYCLSKSPKWENS
ncbi:MAG: hypothetical protein EXS67_00730 [Candidatus Margulisbacteria bacterium]|nr:hypothetical protein [Candidatus Margulisiibacteriota bacterium]